MAIQKVAQAPGQEGDKLSNFRVGDRAEAPGNAEQIRPALQAAGVDFWWWLQKKRLQVPSQLFQLIVHAHKGFRILERYFAKLGDGTIAIDPPWHHLSIGKRDLNRGITWNHAKAVFPQIEIGDDFRPQHARDIRGSGHATAGSNLLGYATTAYNMPAFEDESRQSGTRQIRGRRESIVAAPNHDRVVT